VFGFASISNSTAARGRSCTQIIEFLNAAKTAQAGYDQEQKQIQAKIEKLNKGEEAARMKLQTQQCRPTGAKDDANQNQQSCETLLNMILEVPKTRSAADEVIAGLQKKTIDAAEVEKNLIKQAKLDGCAPYGSSPERGETAPEPKPKRTVQRSHPQSSTRVMRDPAPRGPVMAPVIGMGRGGFGIGVGF
jgi:hypothetical protein